MIPKIVEAISTYLPFDEFVDEFLGFGWSWTVSYPFLLVGLVDLLGKRFKAFAVAPAY